MSDKKAVTETPVPVTTEFNTGFKDERGREWQVRLTLQNMMSFARERGLPLNKIFNVNELDASAFTDLAYIGTRYQSRAIATKQTKEEFLTDIDGPSFLKATEAAMHALLNFTLRQLPGEQKTEEYKRIKEIMSGTGETSSS